MKGYLNIPPFKLLNPNSENPILVTRKVEGIPVNQMAESNPYAAQKALSEFVDDLAKVWEKTKKPMDENQIMRNIRAESINMIYILQNDPKFKSLLEKELIINNKNYPPLYRSLTNILEKLRTQRDPLMVLTHGDEHFENILATEEGNYYVIDLRYTGYNSPAQTYNVMQGSALIFSVLTS